MSASICKRRREIYLCLRIGVLLSANTTYMSGEIFNLKVFARHNFGIACETHILIDLTLNNMIIKQKRFVVTLVSFLLFFLRNLFYYPSRYNFNPPKPHFYVVKLRFTGVYIIFLFLHKLPVLVRTASSSRF